MIEFIKEAAGVVPSQRQLMWYDTGFYAFIHFGMNTFTDQEWGNGKEPEGLFDPKKLDCRQWAQAVEDAYAAGFRHFISGMARGCDLYCAEAVLALLGEADRRRAEAMLEGR